MRILALTGLCMVFANASFAADDRPPNAHYFNTNFTSLEFGQASSVVASDNPHSGVFHNPALTALKKNYSFDGGYIENGSGFSLSLVDGESDLAGAGIGYVQVRGHDGVMLRRVPLSAGKMILDHLALGATVSYLQAGKKTTWQSDIGVWIRLAQPFSLGIVGKNLLGSPAEFDGRSVQLGFRYELPIPMIMNAYFGRDFQRTKTMSWAIGSEFSLPYNIVAFGGIRQTGYEGLYPYWSTGLGYAVSDVGIHISYEQPVKSSSYRSFFFSVTYVQ